MPVLRKLKKRKTCEVLLLIEDFSDETDFVIERKFRLCQKLSNVFTTQERNGVFKSLFTKHFSDDKTKFKAYFRFTRESYFTC